MIIVRRQPQDGVIDDNFGELSLMSKLMKFLIKIRFVPVNADLYKATFKLFSFETFTYSIVYMGTLYLTLGLKTMIPREVLDVQKEISMKSDPVDAVSIAAFFGCLYLDFPMCPLFLAHALSSVPAIALAMNLKWPKNGTIIGIAFSINIIGSSLTEFGIWAAKSNEKNVLSGTVILSVLILTLLGNILISLCWMIPFLLVSTWMEKLIRLCKDDKIVNNPIYAKYCLGLYSDIEKGFGSFFLYV